MVFQLVGGKLAVLAEENKSIDAIPTWLAGSRAAKKYSKLANLAGTQFTGANIDNLSEFLSRM
jgi:hypothetical protein